MTKPLRIAMWSGPRNISTAMMRAFENRPDTCVIDEPFYACYLKETGLEHPMRAEVLASQPQDWRLVLEGLRGPLPERVSVFYQKHMTQHMLPTISLDWLEEVTNCFLIRNPFEIVASFAEKMDRVTEEDIGLKRQVEIFDQVCNRTGHIPPVLDSNDVLKGPQGQLTKLCNRLGLTFMPQMTSWPKGARESDGVWAPHWYQNVENSTGFAPWREREVTLPSGLQEIAEAGMVHYEKMKRHAI